MTNKKAMPAAEQETKEIPAGGLKTVPVPEESKMKEELPQIGTPENTVIIGGKLIEIKPTKLKYQRNRTAVFYHILEMYPLADILAMGPKSFGDDLDGDKKLYDWLVAATDDEELVREHYDEIDSELIYRILEIFRRVNRISEKEEKLKNAKTPRED